MQIVKETEYVVVTYISETRILKFKWKGLCSSEEYRDTFLVGLKYAETNTVDYFLSDITKQNVVAPADRKWFEEVAMIRAIELRLKKAAVVFDGNIFKKYYLTHIMNRTRNFKLPFKFFGSGEEAEAWLLS